MCDYCSVGTQFLVWNAEKSSRIFARKTCLEHLGKAVADVDELYGSGIVVTEKVD